MNEKEIFKLLDNLHDSSDFTDALKKYKKEIKPAVKDDMPRGMWFFSRGFLSAIHYMKESMERGDLS